MVLVEPLSIVNKKKRSIAKKVKFNKSKLAGSTKKRKKSSSDGKKNNKRYVNGNYRIIKGKLKKVLKKQWKIYSKNGCSFCEKAENFMKEKNYIYDYTDFSLLPDIQQDEILKNIEKQRPGFETFPRIFDPEGYFVGGYSDLVAYSQQQQNKAKFKE